MMLPMSNPVFLSDIGNVLVTFDFSIAARRLAERSRFPAEAVLGQVEALKIPFEDGRMDAAAFVERSIEAIGFAGTAEEFQTIWCEIFAQNDPMAASVARLEGTEVPRLMLSNTSDIHLHYLTATFPVFRHFSDGVYSFSAKSSKPAEGIFHQVIERFGLEPGLTLYVDDLPANVETARRLGFRTVHYHPAEHAAFESEFEQWAADHKISLSRAVDAPPGLP